MAQAKKSKTTARKTTARKTTKSTAKRPAAKKQATDGISVEIFLCIMLAVAVLLCISNFGIGGVAGDAVSSFFFGVFGFAAYLFPFVMFFAVAFFLANKENSLVIRKIIGGVVCYLFLCGFLQLLMDGYQKGAHLLDFYILSSQDKLGGGLVGGFLVFIFGGAFGLVGAYVLVIFGLIVGAIIMTQKPLLSQLHTKGSRVYQEARMEHKRRREMERENPSRTPVKNAKQLELSNLELKESAEDTGNTKAKKKEAKETFNTEDLILQIPINRGDVAVDTPAFDEKKREANLDPLAEAKSLAETTKKKKTVLPVFGSKETQPISPAPIADLQPVESVTMEEESAESKERNLRNPRSSKEEIESNIDNIKQEIQASEPVKPKKVYKFPPLSLLKTGSSKKGDSDQHLRETAAKLQQTLHNFGVNVTVTNASCGPTVTRYELQPEQGVKVSKIVSLTDDIKLNLAASDIRIEAPIPGKAAVGIEVPNAVNTAVMLKELVQSEAFVNTNAQLPFAVGKDIAGKTVVADIAKMPHLLIAGATGSGKSVCINTLIMSLLFKSNPEDVKLIMIDPKVVELSVYNGIPHLLIPVVTDPKKAAGALNWAVAEMMERYNIFADFNVRDAKGYNEKAQAMIDNPDIPEDDKPKKMPQIVIIVDELADLMMVAPGEVEDAICRLAQLARAAGLHLIIATQRPSVNVITGLIKANMPSRIAFSVSSGVDSRTILDINGAEKLLGKGDMLFYPQGYPKPARLQGAFVSDEEVSKVVDFLASQQGEVVYNTEVESKINSSQSGSALSPSGSDDRDAYFSEAGKFIIEKDKASIGMLQRVFKIGFNRAARIMDQLCDAGVVGEEEGTKPRKVLVSMEQFEQILEEL